MEMLKPMIAEDGHIYNPEQRMITTNKISKYKNPVDFTHKSLSPVNINKSQLIFIYFYV